MTGRLARTFIRVAFSLLLILGAPATVLACPICFQIEQGPVTAGMRAAVAVLIGVTLVVLAGFVSFAVRVVRRGAALTRTEPRP